MFIRTPIEEKSAIVERWIAHKLHYLFKKYSPFVWHLYCSTRKEHLIDNTTEKMLEGTAFHWYSGNHFEALGIAHDMFPEMTLISSECCALHPPGQKNIFAAFLGGVTSSVAEVEYEDAVAYGHDIIGH